MTKFAAPALLAGTALTAGSSLLNAHGQRQHLKRQDRANKQWLDYQNRRKNILANAEAEDASRARQVLDTNLDAQTQPNREAVIETETDRLADAFAAELPQATDAIRGSGQEAGISRVFDNAMAGEIANQTRDAKDRMKALATATAYGGGSRYGMGMTDQLRDMNTGFELSGIADERRGNIRDAQRAYSVQPEMLSYEQSPLVPMLGAAGQVAVSGGIPSLADTLVPGGFAPWAVQRAMRPVL